MDKIPVPNFLIIGAMKSATTALYQLLLSHPLIWMPDDKEPGYFANTDRDGTLWLDYLELFSACPDGVNYLGEASTDYTKFPHTKNVPERIKARLGLPKLIYILRDPVQRSISHYKHSYGSGAYPDAYCLSDAIKSDPIIVDTSRYIKQLEVYWQVFEQADVHVLTYESLLSDTGKEVARLARFLDLDFSDKEYQLPYSNSAGQLGKNQQLKRTFGKYMKLGSYLPNSIKQMIANLLVKELPMPVVDDAGVGLLKAMLAEDTCRLNEFLGEDFYAIE